MTPIPKEHALEACKKCPRNGKDKDCICGDIEASKEAVHNPPECLIFQFNQILKNSHEPQEKSATKKIQQAQTQTVALLPETVAMCYQKNPASADSNGSTFARNGSNVLPKHSKNGSKSGMPKEGKLPDLTETERDILQLISKGITARKKLAVAHKSGAKCIDKYLTKLKKKGYINKDNTMVANIEGTLLPSAQKTPGQPPAEGSADLKEHPIRVHAQQWRIEILWKDERYKKKVGTTSYDDGNTIYCGRDAIEIYSIQSFIADTVNLAFKNSMDYWELFFHRVENDYNIKLVKPRSQNIKIVKWEWAEVGNELATHCEQTGDKIKVYSTEDNKLWLEMDNSFNLRECETKHPQTAKDDMRDTVVPFFNDLRDKKPPKLSDMMELIARLATTTDKQAEINKETASGLSAIATFMQWSLPKNDEKEKKKETRERDIMYA